MKNISAKIIFVLLSLVVMLSVISLSVCAETSQETANNDTSVVTTEDVTVLETTVDDSVETVSVETKATNEENTAATTQEAGALDTDFTPANFISNLKYMAAGMVGIFIVIGAIVLCIVILGKVTDRKKNDEES